MSADTIPCGNRWATDRGNWVADGSGDRTVDRRATIDRGRAGERR